MLHWKKIAPGDLEDSVFSKSGDVGADLMENSKEFESLFFETKKASCFVMGYTCITCSSVFNMLVARTKRRSERVSEELWVEEAEGDAAAGVIPHQLCWI